MRDHATQALVDPLEHVVDVGGRERQRASERHASREQDLAHRVDLRAIERAAAAEHVQAAAAPVVDHGRERTRLEVDTFEQLDDVTANAQRVDHGRESSSFALCAAQDDRGGSRLIRPRAFDHAAAQQVSTNARPPSAMGMLGPANMSDSSFSPRAVSGPTATVGSSAPSRPVVHARRKAGALVIDNLWRTLAAAGAVLPAARPSRHGVERIRNIAYLDSARDEHRLDVYRPRTLPADAPTRGLPVVLYVHGGGFRVLSKESHWVMGLAFARAGYVVFNIGYRLAPEHPYPAALQDVAAAYQWVLDHAAAYGGDPSRVVLAGESAGANLVAATTIATVWRRDEPWARALFDRDAVPRACMPACGLLQVSDPQRFERTDRPASWFIMDRLHEVTDAYIGHLVDEGDATALADPLCVLESGTAFDRTLPPFFAPVGTRDPVIHDHRRLAAALTRRNVPFAAPEYRGEPHAFHALVFRRNARRCWSDAFAFLSSCV